MEEPPLYIFDEARRAEFPTLAGVDEAGRGPWAGPVVAAAVILNPDVKIKGLNDSKKLSPEIRERLFGEIRRESFFYASAVVGADVIDEINILRATFLAMNNALSELKTAPGLVLVDGNQKIPLCPFRQETVVKGDGLSASIAAASILAKVTRDRLMIEAHEKFPRYNFKGNKGYGTPDHQEALRRFGPCPLHRQSYAPVRESVSRLLVP